MVKLFSSHKLVFIFVFSVLSFLAGGVNGFLGTGGGIIFVYTLSLITNNDKKDNFAQTLCATIPISAITLFNYAKAEMVDYSLMKEIWLPCALGGLVGAVLVERLKLPWLKGIFAILVIYSGTCMIFR